MPCLLPKLPSDDLEEFRLWTEMGVGLEAVRGDLVAARLLGGTWSLVMKAVEDNWARSEDAETLVDVVAAADRSN